MKQVVFILPESRLDAAQTLQDAFEQAAGEPVLRFGPAHWVDPDGQHYSIAAGLLDSERIAQVQDLTGTLFILAPEATRADPSAILLIETDAPLERLQALALSVQDVEGP